MERMADEGIATLEGCAVVTIIAGLLIGAFQLLEHLRLVAQVDEAMQQCEMIGIDRIAPVAVSGEAASDLSDRLDGYATGLAECLQSELLAAGSARYAIRTAVVRLNIDEVSGALLSQREVIGAAFIRSADPLDYDLSRSLDGAISGLEWADTPSPLAVAIGLPGHRVGPGYLPQSTLGIMAVTLEDVLPGLLSSTGEEVYTSRKLILPRVEVVP